MYPYVLWFEEWCGSRGYSPHTTRLRADSVKQLIAWCAERGIERPQDVTRPLLERYRRHLYHYRKGNGAPLSFITQQTKLVSVRVFFKWLARENHILANPASELELPRATRRLPSAVLTPEQIEQVMAQTLSQPTHGVRDRAILETLYSTGVRRSELVRLKVYDVDFKGGSLFVREGKGHKDRYVPLGARAIHWIERYLHEVRPELVLEPDAGYLFLHEYGEPLHRSRLSDLVKRYLLAVGIEQTGSCHLFRHAMATQMLENGADIRFIQAILGHSQLSTTEIYTHVSIAKLKDIHARTHPAERATQGPMSAPSAEARALLASLAAEAETD